MIKYGLKLWSNNVHEFSRAVEKYRGGNFDFVEVYSNSEFPHDYEQLEILKGMPVEAVHIGHLDKAGFHDFFLTDEQKPAWGMTADLADFFGVKRIIVHPAVNHTEDDFWENLGKLNDERIVIETMPVVSPMGGKDRIFGASLESIEDIAEKKEICIDFEKSIKAAIYFKKDYKNFIQKLIKKSQATYFHISGCDVDNPVDQHTNLWEAGFDVEWIHKMLEDYAQDKTLYLLFETPKSLEGLENDVKNIRYFKNA